jgi:mRNA degradation ribonuclease J1/J2
VVSAELENIMRETAGKVVVIAFASSVWRFLSVLSAAEKAGRRVCFVGRSMERNLEIARTLGFVANYQGIIVTEDEAAHILGASLCVVASGSQGENLSAAMRLAAGQIKNVELRKDDTVVLSARTIPGNERSVASLLNRISKIGCRIVTPRERAVHVSGHGFAEDIVTLVRFVRPRYYVPVHGQYRHMLANAALAVRSGVPEDSVFVVENGSVLELRKGFCRKSDEAAQVGVLHVAQGLVVEKNVLKQRESMAYGGIVVASFFLLRDGSFASEPRAVVRGVVVSEEDLQNALPRLYELAMAKKERGKQRPSAPEDLVRSQIKKWIENSTAGVRATICVLIQRSN